MPAFLLKKKLADMAKRHQREWRWLGDWFRKSNLWRFRREAVARGVAIGFLVGFIPLPIQIILAISVGAILRANLAIAILTTWFSNPFTLVPLTLLIYKTGSFVTGENHAHIFSALSSDLSFLSLFSVIRLLGKNYLIGLPIVSFVSAVLSYLITHVIWFFSYRANALIKRRKSLAANMPRMKK